MSNETKRRPKEARPIQHLDTIWPLLTAGISDNLINPTAVSHLQAIMSHLPLLSGGGFECRLDGQDETVDLAMRLTEADGGFNLLERPFAAFPQPKSKAHRQIWQRLQTFAQARNDASNNLHHAIKEAWFEFDLTEETKSVIPPNFFFKLEEHFARPPKLGPQAEARRKKTAVLIQTALTHLGLPLSPPTQETLEKCLRDRPASSKIAFVGLMLARRQPGFRLTVGNMPLSELTAYLKKIGWPHNHHHLVPLLRFLGKYTTTVQLNLDIADQPQAKLGLELSFHGDDHEQDRWHDFLRHTNRHTLSTPAKTTAVLNWPGQHHRQEAWPPILQGRYNHLVRNINHVKLSYDPTIEPFAEDGLPILKQQAGTAVAAKAYIAFHYVNTFPHPAYWTN